MLHQARFQLPTADEAVWAAQAHLAQGNFGAGFRLYEARWAIPEFVALNGQTAGPCWRGEPIAGRTIRLWSEQGFGDTIQFARYVPLVASLGARVLLRVPRPLRSLMRSSFDGVEILAPGDFARYQLHCPLMSLPLAFGTTLETIPRGRYLKASAERLHAWRERLGPKRRLRVGLAWTSGHLAHRPEAVAFMRSRDVPLGALMALRVPRAEFFSLQKERDAAQRSFGAGLIDWSAELHDFEDTAALIESLDVVVSVDTAVAHLAGALGKLVWVLLPHDADWRWLRGRDDCPWYPTARLYRQEKPGDWEPVIARVAVDLARIA